ncbi:protein translocase subunit SecD [Candidatus Woesebacteria bacterium]|nr:protein translocase subunit SecD [Candidatus Woesebacteria bacterium]
MRKPLKVYLLIILLVFVAGLIALPQKYELRIPYINRTIAVSSPHFTISTADGPKTIGFVIKKGLDIQGGMQILLEADMTQIPEADRVQALESAREVLLRRVDLYGIAEPSVKTTISNGSYRLIIELPGVTDPQKALELVGQTAKLEFMLIKPLDATSSAGQSLSQIQQTDLDGGKLKKAHLQFDQKTGKPVVGIEFTNEGAAIFSKITEEHIGEMLGIVLDGSILMAPQINEPIFSGSAIIQGGFSVEEARQLSIQLNAGALPVPIKVLEQRTVGASLGSDSVTKSVMAGCIGLAGVIIFMIALYGFAGVLASFALVVYALLTVAIYKIIGVTITVPGIAGLLLSIGMAVDANILIFERMKEETRLGKPFGRAMELGFGRAWDSIKDANITTIITALVLINPLNFSFLNTSGLVRGFGITLLIGVLLGLFTSIVVSRTFLRMFLQDSENKEVS